MRGPLQPLDRTTILEASLAPSVAGPAYSSSFSTCSSPPGITSPAMLLPTCS